MSVIEVLMALIIWLLVIFVAYYLTEVKPLPKWLQFPPFQCHVCLTFWSNLAVFLTIGLAMSLWHFLVAGLILTVLAAISMKIDQKKKTVKAEDIEIIDEGDEIKIIRK